MLRFSNCQYYDGLSATSTIVQVIAIEDKLYLTNVTNGLKFVWDISKIKILQKPIENRAGLCSNQDMPDVRLGLNLDLFEYLNPKIIPLYRQLFPKKIVYSIMAATISIVGTMYYVISNHSFLIANYTPLSLEMMLGDYTEKLLFLDSKNEITENKQLNKIVEKLSQHLDMPQAIKVYIIHTKKPPNAAALPNRKIYIYSTLIKSTHSPDELTGVIAHEMAHIIKHHATIHYLRHLSLSLIVKSSIGAGNTVDIAGLLLNPYSQAIEIEADTIAAEILYRNNISSAGLKTFFDKIRTPENDLFLSNFLSTHPSSDIRIHHLNLLPTVVTSKPILTDPEWLELKRHVSNHR